jgi:hypothetical protein
MFSISFSNNFYYFLCDIKENLIAKILLDYNYCIKSEYSFIDINPKDKVTFLTTDKVNKLHLSDDKYSSSSASNFVDNNRQSTGPIYNNMLRTEIKIGRIIKKIFEQEKFDTLFKDYREYHKELKSFDELLEELTIAYKCQTKKIYDTNFDSKIVLLSGEDIKKWYDESNYVPPNKTKGSLHESCMRHSKCVDFLNIYSKNPEVCQMLIFKEEDKISMRALVWKLTNGKTYMDRIYSATNSDTKIFEDYAKKNNWLYYVSAMSDSSAQNELVTEVKHTDFIYYPYMDTFMHHNVKDKKLSFLVKNLNTGVIRLRSQGGGWS